MATVNHGSNSRIARFRRSQWIELVVRAAHTRRGKIGLIISGIVAVIAFLGPLVAPHSSLSFIGIPFSPASASMPLGGDILGRDVLSRVLDGGWLLLLMALGATAFGIVLGGVAGMAAAYLRGRSDSIIMRTVDVMLAFPALVFVLLLVSLVGPKLWLIMMAVGLVHAPAVARVLRSATLDVSERDYVRAVELQGVKSWKIMRQEILPNLVSPLMVEIGLRLTYSIVIMAGLAFLGFGQPPPSPNWGYMIQENRIGLSANSLAVIAPAALIALFTIGTNTFTDAVARVAIGLERSSGSSEDEVQASDVRLGTGVN
ncbi:ABC transporter permease [Acidithrix ferrooxidans]|uniref:Putative D,D-dipeptide transport system permease protein DdpC n=1 Tax=Acidithrix ferrooxidans TaxID=1280514 RepID=A0A0D8HDI4_9ACTN|nr:ABC transporter permease [Acidithrix ferrooxidans]KJF16020.1 putative D,D-dipeptide transport system permease protein DdpC [Acidithrix ferrooxidans]